MSETSDDLPRVAKVDEGGRGPLGEAPDADDVEVVAVAPEPTSAAHHDSMLPTSRKLAPPPKPKRDSSQPSSFPPAAEGPMALGSLRAPGPPTIAYQQALAARGGEASEAPRPQPSDSAPPPAALGGIPVGFSSAEPSAALRQESHPPAPPAEAPPERAVKAPSIFAQRIISVGVVSERPPPAPEKPPLATSVSASLAPPDEPFEVAFRASELRAAPRASEPALAAAPALPRASEARGSAAEPALLTSEPRLRVSEPLPRTSEPAPRVSEPAPRVSEPAPRVSEPAPRVSGPAFPPPRASEPALPPPRTSEPASPRPRALPASEPARASEPALASASPRASEPGHTSEPALALAAALTSEAALRTPEPLLLSLDAPPDLDLTMGLAAGSALSIEVTIDDDSTADIPITTDEDEQVTSPTGSPAPLDQLLVSPAVPAPPPIPVEVTPPPPLLASERPARSPAPPEAEPAASVERLQVKELSREDAPSIPPDAPVASAPPPPSARADAKPPPPPKRAPAPTGAAEPEKEKKKAKGKRAWWEELFGEDFVRANWKVSDEQIKREVTFVEESLGVAPGGVVLDLGCGSGQHAIELASRGYGVVGYDLSLYQLALAADLAQERSQKINFLQGDMREMAFEEMFDGIYCWNTSFGYFEEDKNFSVAERAFRALRPGGMFLVDVMNRDFVAAHTPSSVWFEGDACVCMDDAVIDYYTSRLRVKRSVILDDGRTRECTYSVRLYSFHELGKLLHEVGFRVTEVSGHPATPGVFLGQASPRILMLAQRP
jgi:SAM-dependent methyltransferase